MAKCQLVLQAMCPGSAAARLQPVCRLHHGRARIYSFAALGVILACVLQALVMDTAGLSRQSKSLDSQLANIRHLSEKTSGQLVRSAWVFSTALGIPSPLSETSAEH